jgi:hypothetical protein
VSTVVDSPDSNSHPTNAPPVRIATFRERAFLSRGLTIVFIRRDMRELTVEAGRSPRDERRIREVLGQQGVRDDSAEGRPTDQTARRHGERVGAAAIGLSLGRVQSSAERAGAYDFLENADIPAAAVAKSVFDATAARARGMKTVYVMVDGSALSLSDANGAKGFGPVGSPNTPVKGLKVMNALAVARAGVPLGLVDQIYWNRPPTEKMTTAERTKRNLSRPFADKETSRFLQAAENAISRLEREGVHSWIVIDREADNRDILLGLHRTGCTFTVRGRWDRALFGEGKQSLNDILDAQPSLGSHDVEVGRTGQRAARRTTVEVRAAIVTLRFAARGPDQELDGLRLYAVRVREVNAGEKGLDWLLLTNTPGISVEHARAVLDSYRARWRIEEFHRTPRSCSRVARTSGTSSRCSATPSWRRPKSIPTFRSRSSARSTPPRTPPRSSGDRPRW